MHTPPNATAAPYLLLFRNAGEESHRHLTPEQRVELTRQWNDWFDRLAAQGKVQDARPLELGGRVLSGARGEKVTDGPYAEAKEVVGGFFIITALGIDEATDIAKGCPGLAIGLTVEVRPIAACSPVLKGVEGHGPA